jgi:hypothetical protein
MDEAGSARTGNAVAIMRTLSLWLLALGLLAGWFWAASGIEAPFGRYPLVQRLQEALLTGAMAILAVVSVVWLRGRRRVEDGAERARQPIGLAVDAYDSRYGWVLSGLSLVAASYWLLASTPKALELFIRANEIRAVMALLAPALGVVTWLVVVVRDFRRLA